MIVHETIHAYIRINKGENKTLLLGDNPNAINKKNTRFGTLADYFGTRYPPNAANKDMFRKSREDYGSYFLDIDKNSQAFIKKIVP